jgi:bifunctional enzyme CysN/CysC
MSRRYPGSSVSGIEATESAQHGLLRIFTCGSVDDGKSTLLGRMLYDSKRILSDEFRSLKKDSNKFGTTGEEVDLALLVDGLEAEREQGITIDVAYRYFATDRRSFIVADTPGHEQYTCNMVTGASTAELAIVLVDARKGLLPQTFRHSIICDFSISQASYQSRLPRVSATTLQRREHEWRGMAGLACLNVWRPSK